MRLGYVSHFIHGDMAGHLFDQSKGRTQRTIHQGIPTISFHIILYNSPKEKKFLFTFFGATQFC